MTGFLALRILDMANCGITSWFQILSLGMLSSIQELVLDSNPISAIIPAPEGIFKTLQRLALSSSK